MSSEPTNDESTELTPEVSRRRALGIAGLGAAAIGGLAYVGREAVASADSEKASALAAGGLAPRGLPIAFHGPHQAGIATPVQDRLHFTTFDVKTENRGELISLLQAWTRAAERMCSGLDAVEGGAFPRIPEYPPGDTGEAVGLPASRLTLTIGFGPTLFRKGGKDRFGLTGRKPEALEDLPKFRGDTLDPLRSGGDIAVQACSDDPQVAVHAIRNLARIGFGTVSVRWSQLGFGKTSSTTPEEQTPRNLFGFKDGTNNPAVDDTATLDQHIWVGAEDEPEWLRGGSYLVARRIRMLIEIWDRTSLVEQERIIGRDKAEGAPAGLRFERDPVDPAKQPPDSHVLLAMPETNDGATILRRGYSFVDGSDGLGRLDAGLFFLAYQRDPRTGFIPVQQKLARADVLNEYIRHTGSGVYACPPGVTGPDRWWGDTLFA
ncbi:iron uptake transporter deferrochelatase/peroxidase subunit [Sporichthya brevicatena]|uniref:Deferrochelatase n=1 Tax=Sporichthya brevicatena TaxID=171442 RepID=A0ABN1GY37_9ACTN